MLNLRAGVSNAPKLPHAAKHAVSTLARGANTALQSVGLSSNTLGFFGHRPVHPLAENYYSQVPLRWGDYIAKIGLFPTKETLESLAEYKIDTSDANAFRNAMSEHFRARGATFQLRVQLALNPDDMPVENAAKKWPEDQSPYRTVATLTLEPQDCNSAARRRYFDQRLSFNPANSIRDHQPLGQIMRARLFVYQRLAALRQKTSGELLVEPDRLSEVPD